MKKILVPIDFSPISLNAFDYSISLAIPGGGKITLLNAYKVYSSSGMFVSVEKYMKEDALRDMKALMGDTEPKLPD